MTYISLPYVGLVLASLFIYYVLPLKYRWCALLLGSVSFYVLASSRHIEILVFGLCIACSYVFGLLLEKQKKPIFLFSGIVLSAVPLFYARLVGLLPTLQEMLKVSVLLPVGLSFWSMQMIAYLVDVYQGKEHSQRHFLKYVLFMSFFPQIIQGPIPRYGDLQKQLYRGHRYQRESFLAGLQLILFGLFLKFMIADKAGVVVDTIFADVWLYQGAYGWIAGLLYSFQLYADFLSCSVISIGTASLFGITLKDNFNHPYFARSIAEFWRRWHISLSSWLKDYIYIPLGGSRKGEIRRYFNLVMTFVVSGIWHGMGLKFLIWGLLHGFYQIMGRVLAPCKEKIYHSVHMDETSLFRNLLKVLGTFVLVMLGWIIFRADTLADALVLLKSMVTIWNPWVLVDGSLTLIGLSYGEWAVLCFSLVMLFVISKKQEEGVQIRKWFAKQNPVLRWIVLFLVIALIWIFGTYGFGYHAQDFIYGGF